MADDVVFNIAGDSSSAVTSIGEVLQAAQELDAAFTAIADSIQLVQDGLAKFGTVAVDFGTIAADSDTVSKSFADLSTSIDAVVQSITPLAQLLLDVASNMAGLDLYATDAATTLGEFATAAGEAATNLDDLDPNIGDVAGAMADMNLVAPAVATAMDEIATSTADAALALDAYTGSAGAAASANAGFTASTAAAAAGSNTAASASSASAAAEDEASASTAAHTRAGQDNGMMLMMLVPLLLQGADAFIKQGSSAEDAIAKIKGLADQSLALKQNQGELDTVINTLQSDAVKYGVSMTDAANGMYYIKSAGFSTADSMKVLDASMKTAAATGADMTAISNGLTSVLHAYNLKASDADSVTNKMATAVVQGKQDFGEFAQVIGRTADAGHLAGMSFDEVLTAEATLTQINPSVQRDTEHLANLFITLSDDTQKTADAAKKLGLKFDETKYKSMDLYDKLNYVKTVTHGNTQEMQKLFLNATSAAAGFDLLTNNGEVYRTTMGHIKNDTDSLSVAFQQQQQTMSFAWEQIQADISVVSYQLVAMIGPIVGPILKQFADMLGSVAMNANTLKPIFIGLAVAIGVLVFGALGALVGLMAEAVSIFVVMGVAVGGLITAILLLAPKFEAAAQAATPLGREIRVLQAQFKSAADYISKEWNRVVIDTLPILESFAFIIKQYVIPALISFGGGVGQTIISMLHHFGDALKAIVPFLMDFYTWIHDKLMPKLKELGPQINAVANVLGRLSPFLVLLLPGIIGVALNLEKLAGSAGFVAKALGGAGEIFKVLVGIVSNIVPALIRIPSLFTAMGGGIKIAIQAVSGFIGAIGPALQAAIGGVGNAINGLKTIFGASLGPMDLIKNLFIALGDVLSPIGEAIAAISTSFAMLSAVTVILIAATVTFFTQTSLGRALIAMLWQEILKLGSVIMSDLQPAWQAIQASMKQLAPLWGQIVEAGKPLYPLFILIGGIIGGVLVVAIGLLISALVGIITALGQVIAGAVKFVTGIIQIFAGLVEFFSGLLTVIVGIFTLNGATIQKGWGTMGEGLVNIAKGFWTAIQGVFQASISALIGFVSGFVKTAIGFFQNLADVVVHHSIIPDMWNAIHQSTQEGTTKVQATNQQFTQKMQSQFTDFGKQAPTIMTQTWTKIESDQKTANNAINTAQTTAFNVMQNTTKAAMTNINSQVQSGFATMNTAATNALSTMNTNVKTKFDAMTKVITDDFSKMQTASDKFWSNFTSAVNSNLDKSVKAVQKGFDTMATTVTNDYNHMLSDTGQTWTAIQESIFKAETKLANYTFDTFFQMLTVFQTVGTSMTQSTDDTWQKIVKSTQDGGDKMNTAVQQSIDAITKIFEKLDRDAKTWGADFISNFIDGMKSQQGQLSSAAMQMAQTVKGPLGFSLPSEGPLRDADTYMPDMMQLLAKGIQDNVGLVKTAATQAAQAVQSAAPTSLNIPTSSQSSVSKEHIEVLKDILQAIKDQGKQGQQGTSGQTSIGYPIPSTTLGSINQQFGQNGAGGSGPNMIAGIYTQINQLAGLSNEYAKRGAATGVGF